MPDMFWLLEIFKCSSPTHYELTVKNSIMINCICFIEKVKLYFR